MTTRFSKFVACSLFLLLVASAASAYVFLSPTRRWFETPRSVTIDAGGLASVTTADHGVAAARAAAEAWNAGGVNVVSASAGSVAYRLGDGNVDVIFSDPLHICTGTCLAATTTGYYDTGARGTCGGLTTVRLTDADISFNTAYDFTTVAEGGCSNEIYLEAVVSHEIGHVLGLAHSTTGTALMYPSLSYCGNKPIGSDDRAGRDALYACTLVPDGGSCSLGGPGDACASNGDCCSNACKGKPGRKTCR